MLILKKIMITLVILAGTINYSYASIDIAPQKIIMKKNERSAEITILNRSNKPGTYRVNVENMRQDNTGTYINLENELLNPAFDPRKIVRMTPRQFTLPPGGRQKIRISLRKPPNLKEGEYRFHPKIILFGSLEPNENQNKEGASVRMSTNLGVTIPVIVRHGNTDVSANITDIALKTKEETESKKPELQFTINRSGNASSIGYLQVYQKQENNEQKLIGELKNMNLFTDIEKRFVKLRLYEYPNVNGEITIKYIDEMDENLIYETIIFNK